MWRSGEGTYMLIGRCLASRSCMSSFMRSVVSDTAATISGRTGLSKGVAAFGASAGRVWIAIIFK